MLEDGFEEEEEQQQQPASAAVAITNNGQGINPLLCLLCSCCQRKGTVHQM